jgi:hypothetical protein
VKRFAAAGAALLLAGCSSSDNSTYSQFYKVAKQSLAASFGNVRVTREQAAAIPYASIGYSLDGGNQNILVLATDNGGEQLWTAATHVVLVMRDGRIVRSVGLGNDLAGSSTRESGGLPAPAAAIHGPFTTTRLRDYPDSGQYGVSLTCRSSVRGRQTIKLLGQAIVTVRIDEACTSSALRWSFVDSYWVDPESGLAWRTRQHIHPKGGIIETDVFRPPG